MRQPVRLLVRLLQTASRKNLSTPVILLLISEMIRANVRMLLVCMVVIHLGARATYLSAQPAILKLRITFYILT
jgi:hypothetical protein